MVDVTIVGGGASAHSCIDTLSRAGLQVRRAPALEAGDRSPVILGESIGAFAVARQAVETGRHLLIASPATLPADRLSLLLASRKRAQSIFVWNDRRYHPAYRFVNGLVESDATWQPHYLRHETLSLGPTTNALSRWHTLEAVALVLTLTPEVPLALSAVAHLNAIRNAPDLVSLRLAFHGLEAFVQVGMGEAIERRETLVAAADRKAYVDELNQSMPLRLVEDESRAGSAGQARWPSCPLPDPEDLARLQCVAFLDSTLKPDLAQAETTLWLRSLAVLQAATRSFAAHGALTDVELLEEQPRFRVVDGRSLTPGPSAA